MTSEIQLIALKCTQCGKPLSAKQDDIVLYCGGCGSAFEIADQKEPTRVNVYFARLNRNAEQFHSFWAFDAILQGANREAKGGFLKSPKGLMQFFEQRPALRFYVSAELSDLSESDPLGLQLTRAQPELEFLQYQKEIPRVEISQEDARKIADFLIITSEAGQSDNLRSIGFQLQLNNPMLIAICL
jgi:hypothetical protein